MWQELENTSSFFKVSFPGCLTKKPGELWNQEKSFCKTNLKIPDTVHGSEIRRSPVEVGSFYPIVYQGFSTMPSG